jgi:hypothetical protein
LKIFTAVSTTERAPGMAAAEAEVAQSFTLSLINLHVAGQLCVLCKQILQVTFSCKQLYQFRMPHQRKCELNHSTTLSQWTKEMLSSSLQCKSAAECIMQHHSCCLDRCAPPAVSAPLLDATRPVSPGQALR